MNSNLPSWIFLILISFIHLGGLFYMVTNPATYEITETIKPSIQGVLIFPTETVQLEKTVSVKPEPQEIPKSEKKHKKQEETKPKRPSEKALPNNSKLEKKLEPKTTIEKPSSIKEQTLEEESKTPTLPSADASELHNPAPAYPNMSRKLKEEGIVLLKILVTKEGQVAQIEIKNSSGFKRLDDVAVKTIRHWKFIPATKAGEAIDYWYELPIEFNLRKK